MAYKEYAHEEHYQWVESNNKIKCSELGKTVANIIGFVGGGIYNCPVNHRKTDYTDKYYIKVHWRQYMSNWDFSGLSLLWIICHRRKVRVSISAVAPKILKLEFWQRRTRKGSMSERLPDCEEMIGMVDEMFKE